jgi:hypothetical protein
MTSHSRRQRFIYTAGKDGNTTGMLLENASCNLKELYLFMYGAGVESGLLLPLPYISLLYQLWVIDDYDCGAVDGMNEWQGKPKFSEKICPSSALSTADPK